MNHQFELPGSYKKWTWGLIVAGVLALLYGFIMFHPFAPAGHGHGGEHSSSTRFWAVLLQNSVYWLLVVKCFDVLHLCYHNGNGWMAGCHAQGSGSDFKCTTDIGHHYFYYTDGHRLGRPYRYLSLAR
jgi:hypothetical protein